MTGTILVVEDEHIVGRDIQAMLEDLGYSAVVAVSGEEAVEKTEVLSPASQANGPVWVHSEAFRRTGTPHRHRAGFVPVQE